MTRYVPIIAVVPEGIAAVVAEMAEAPDFAALMEPSVDPAEAMVRAGKTLAGRVLDGRTWDEMPEVAR